MGAVIFGDWLWPEAAISRIIKYNITFLVITGFERFILSLPGL
jgi:hypothetical protein